MANHGVPTNPEESRVFPQIVEAAASPFGTQRHTRAPKTCSHLKTATKPENKTYDHFTPISGQGSALNVAASGLNVACRWLLGIYAGTKERNMELIYMGEAIPPERGRASVKGSSTNDNRGAGAIPTSVGFIHVELKEDLRLGEQHLLAKQSPRDILKDAIKKGEWFKGIILSSAFFEHFGSLKLRENFQGSISDDKIRNFNLGELIVFLFGLKLLTQNGYSKIMRVKNKRDDLAHYPFAKTDPKEAERLILDAIDCLKELGAA